MSEESVLGGMSLGKSGDYAKFKSRAIRKLLEYPFVAVVMHWTFQSLLYMDPTERWFKLALDLVLAVPLGLGLSVWVHPIVAWWAAILVAHTMNFLFNGQLWGVLKHYGLVRHTPAGFDTYVQGFCQRAAHESAIQYVAVYGSLVRSEWSSTSDFDARIVRHPGLGNGLKSCWFLLVERSRALISRFPIDVYVLDSKDSLKKLRSDEKPLLVAGPRADMLGEVR